MDSITFNQVHKCIVNIFIVLELLSPHVNTKILVTSCSRTHDPYSLAAGIVRHYSTLMVICPCRVGGAVWNHTAWLFPLMPLPTLSLFYSYFLSGNKYRKNITCENMGQFQFCINLLPLELIWRSASCPRHWNQRWFGDAAFTIPSGKQWDHMSPWPPSWLSAGIEECCRSANESGHQWLKNRWLETIWH